MDAQSLYAEEGQWTALLRTGHLLFAGRRQHKAEKGIIPMEENESLYGTEAEEVVTPQGEDAAKNAEGAEGSESPEQNRQSREDNRRYQAARKAGEKAGYQRAVDEINKRITKTGMRDPETGETFASIDGLENYAKAVRDKRIRKQAEETGRSVQEITEEEDARDYLAEKKAEERAKKKEADEEEKIKAWISQDVASFREEYPEVDVAKLAENNSFLKFCGSRFGKEPMAELYADWLDLVGSAERAAVARKESKASRSTGTGGGSGSETLTAVQQRELDEWNRNYPNMKMTAKEFLSR